MPNCPLTLRTVKGSKLTFNELDGNFLSLNSCISNLQSQIDALGDNSLNNRWHVPLGTTVVIDDGYQGFVYGDLYVEGLIELNGDSQLVVVNGDIIMSGGTVSGTGTTYLVDLPTYNTFVTGGTYNTPTQSIDLSGNYGFNSFSIDLSSVISNSLNNRWHVPVGTTVVVNDGYQGFVYGDLYVEGLIELNGNSQLVVVNGDIIMSGGTISGTGVTYLVDLPTYDSFVTGGTYNISTQSIDLSGNYGFNPFSVDLSSLSTDNFYLTAGTYNSLTNNIDFTGNNIATDFSVNVLALSNDITVVSGVYNNTTGIATFTNSTGGTFDVSGFLTGYTNYYTTGATLNGTTIEFDRTDLLNAYSVDLSSLKFTGNTSGDCISDLHVSNIHACSPLNINPLDEGNVYFGSTSGVTIDVLNSRIGIGITNPSAKLHVNGNSIFSGATTDVVKIYGSGTTTPIFSVQGSSGELFSISDSLVGSLFSVNDISGLPILETFSDNTVLMGSYQAPSLNTTIKKLLSAGDNTVYSIPTSAYTGAFFDYTLISSTGARAGNVMAIWSGTSSQYTDVSTNDIGDTSGVIFSVSVTGTTAMFSSSANTSGWTLKTIVRSI